MDNIQYKGDLENVQGSQSTDNQPSKSDVSKGSISTFGSLRDLWHYITLKSQDPLLFLQSKAAADSNYQAAYERLKNLQGPSVDEILAKISQLKAMMVANVSQLKAILKNGNKHDVTLAIQQQTQHFEDLLNDLIAHVPSAKALLTGKTASAWAALLIEKEKEEAGITPPPPSVPTVQTYLKELPMLLALLKDVVAQLKQIMKDGNKPGSRIYQQYEQIHKKQFASMIISLLNNPVYGKFIKKPLLVQDGKLTADGQNLVKELWTEEQKEAGGTPPPAELPSAEDLLKHFPSLASAIENLEGEASIKYLLNEWKNATGSEKASLRAAIEAIIDPQMKYAITAELTKLLQNDPQYKQFLPKLSKLMAELSTKVDDDLFGSPTPPPRGIPAEAKKVFNDPSFAGSRNTIATYGNEMLQAANPPGKPTLAYLLNEYKTSPTQNLYNEIVGRINAMQAKLALIKGLITAFVQANASKLGIHASDKDAIAEYIINTLDGASVPKIPAKPSAPENNVPKEAHKVISNSTFQNSSVNQTIQILSQEAKAYSALLARYNADPSESVYTQLIEMRTQMQTQEASLPANLQTLVQQILGVSKREAATVAHYILTNLETIPQIPAKPTPPPSKNTAGYAKDAYNSSAFKSSDANGKIEKYLADSAKYESLLEQYQKNPTESVYEELMALRGQLQTEDAALTPAITAFLKTFSETSKLDPSELTAIASYLLETLEKAPNVPSQPNPPVPPPSGKAEKEIAELNKLLANPSLSAEQRQTYQKELNSILAGTSQQYGPISGPISSTSPTNLPPTAPGPNNPVSPNDTAWANTREGFYPTNDWFQQFASYPNSQAASAAGVYRVTWAKGGGVTFQMPTGFNDNGDWISQNMSPGFSINASGKPTVQWENGVTGNMERNVSYDNGSVVVHVVQGGVFQSATYNNTNPNLTVAPGGTMTESTLSDGTVKYRIVAGGRVYLVYGTSSLKLSYDQATGKLTSSGPYTGSINITSLAQGEGEAAKEALLDEHANAVIVKAMGSLLPNDQYEYSYVTVGLDGKPTSEEPLLMMKRHEMDDLQKNGLNEKVNLSYTGLTGEMQVYAGSTFSFQVPSPHSSLNALPTLPNGKPALTKAQAEQLIQSGALEKALEKAESIDSGANLYNKEIYNQGITLTYAAEVMKAAGDTPAEIKAKLLPLYQKMEANMTTLFKNLRWDKDYGTIVSGSNDFGDEKFLNDHIVQYGYPLYALTQMVQFGKQYLSSGERFANKPSGISNYTNQQIGDLIASDIGQTGGKGQLARNFDIYNGHSWLSGPSGFVDGNDTESESEAVFGSMSVAAWLETTQPGSTQASLAKTRWAIETQGLQTYYQIDPSNSVYDKVDPAFAKKYPVVSMLWQNKITFQTWWGTNWDRELACENMPAGANMMDNLLNNAPKAYVQRLAKYVIDHWNDFDTTNAIQSVLIQIVAKAGPMKNTGNIPVVQGENPPAMITAKDLIKNIENFHNSYFDSGTSSFILNVLSDYAENENNS